MNSPPKKPIIGLTGAPGAGKSTIARQFEALGCVIVDADRINHQVLTTPTVLQQLISWWGPEILTAPGADLRNGSQGDDEAVTGADLTDGSWSGDGINLGAGTGGDSRTGYYDGAGADLGAGTGGDSGNGSCGDSGGDSGAQAESLAKGDSGAGTEGLAKDDSGAATGGPTGNDTGTGTGSDAGGLAKGDSGNRAAAKAKGTLNRRAVAEIVFSNPAELERLTRLVHPLIAEREKQLVARYRGDSGIAAIVLDVPLLYESGQDRWCDKVIFVDCPESLRRERLRKSRGWEAETTKKIDALQWNTQLKAQRADYVIRNHSSLTELANQVETILARIRQEFA